MRVTCSTRVLVPVSDDTGTEVLEDYELLVHVLFRSPLVSGGLEPPPRPGDNNCEKRYSCRGQRMPPLWGPRRKLGFPRAHRVSRVLMKILRELKDPFLWLTVLWSVRPSRLMLLLWQNAARIRDHVPRRAIVHAAASAHCHGSMWHGLI